MVLTKIGDIDGWGFALSSLESQLNEAGSATDVVVPISSYGGNVIAGTEMYNAIKNHQGKTTAVVSGIAASMGSYLLTAFDEVHIEENSYVMLHNPYGSSSGDFEQLEADSNLLKKMRDNLAKAYASKMNISIGEVREAMRKETWYSAKEAVSVGLATRTIKGKSNFKADAKKMVAFANLPQAFSKPDNMQNMDTNKTTKFDKLIAFGKKFFGVESEDEVMAKIDNDNSIEEVAGNLYKAAETDFMAKVGQSINDQNAALQKSFDDKVAEMEKAIEAKFEARLDEELKALNAAADKIKALEDEKKDLEGKVSDLAKKQMASQKKDDKNNKDGFVPQTPTTFEKTMVSRLRKAQERKKQS